MKMEGLNLAISDLMALVLERRETLILVELERIFKIGGSLDQIEDLFLNFVNFCLFAYLKKDEEAGSFISMSETDLNALIIESVNQSYPDLLARLTTLNKEDSPFTIFTRIFDINFANVMTFLVRNMQGLLPIFKQILDFALILLRQPFNNPESFLPPFFTSTFMKSCLTAISEHHGANILDMVNSLLPVIMDLIKEKALQNSFFTQYLSMLPLVEVWLRSRFEPEPEPVVEEPNPFSFFGAVFPQIESSIQFNDDHLRRLLENVAAEFNEPFPPPEDQE